MMWYDGLFMINTSFMKRKTKKKMADFRNNIVFQNTFARLFADAMKRYEFEGLPETVSERVFKQSLIMYGCACFFERNGSLMCLPAAPNGTLNIYGDPKSCYLFSRNGAFNEEAKLYIHGSDESAFLGEVAGGNYSTGKYKGILVWENPVRYPFMFQIMFFAEAIADTLRTVDVARANLKNPFIIVAEESVVPTVKKFFDDRDSNVEYVISSGIFPVDKVNVLPITTNPETINSATELVEWYENKFRELCGVQSNTSIDKRGENLISDEVHVNDEYEDMSVDSIIANMQIYLDDVNKVFGTNIRVKERETNEQVDDVRGNEDDNDSISGGD